MSRIITFFQSLLQSPSTEVQICTRLAARDIRSNIGANIAAIKNETGLDPWVIGARRIRKELRLNVSIKIEENDKWRIPYLSKLLHDRTIAHFNCNNKEEDHLNDLIHSLVTN